MMRIGLSSCFFHADPVRPIFKGKTLVYAELSMCHWIMSQGAIPVLIPPSFPNSRVGIQDIAQGLDGLVLQGGSDVSPSSYGETPLRPEWLGDPVRDAHELELLQYFLKQAKPILGICRGAQLINVAFGGSLFQDIETQAAGAQNHRNWAIYDQNFHEVRIEPGTRTTRIFSPLSRGIVNTVHHQGIKSLGRGLVAEAFCMSDGIIEAISHENPELYVYGVQWHPEFHDRLDPRLLPAAPLLADFLNEAHIRATKEKIKC